MAWLDPCLQRSRNASGDLVVRLGVKVPDRRIAKVQCPHQAAARTPLVVGAGLRPCQCVAIVPGMRLRFGAVGRRMLRHVHLSMWSLPFASLGVLAAMLWPVGFDAPAVTCAAVCGGDFAVAVLGGLLVGTPVAALVHRPIAAWLSVLVAVCSFWYQDAAMRPSWTGLVGVGYGIVGLLVANRPDRARALAPPEMMAVPPRPLDLPVVRPRWWVLAVPAVVVAAATLSSSTLMVVDIVQQAERSRIPDMSLLLGAGTALLGVAVAAIARAARDHRALRRLFSTPQPVRSLQLVVEEADSVAVLDGPDRAWIRVQPAERPASVGRARIYGDPVVGGWFVSEVDGQVRVPTGPARPLRRSDRTQDLHIAERDPEMWEEDEPVPDHLLVGPDRVPAPATLRTHRSLAGPPGWLQLGFVLLLLGQLGRAVLYVEWWLVAGVVTVALAALLEAGWRRGLICQRVEWNDSGVVVTNGGRPPIRLSWQAVTRITRFGPFVLVGTDDDAWLTRGHLWLGRDRDELWAALTNTWRRSTAHRSTVEPPPARTPNRPLALFAVFLGATALLSGLILLAKALQP